MRFTKFGGTLHPADDEAMNWLLQANEGADLECKAISNRRTAQQNRAIHAFLTDLANNLNAAGFDLLTFPWKEGVEIPWNLDLAKDRLWRPIQEVVTDKKHTADLTTDEVDKVYQPLARKIGQMGVEVPPLGRE